MSVESSEGLSVKPGREIVKGLWDEDYAGPGAMRNQMKNVVEEDGELSDWYVWSAIQYLDPESTSPNRGKPMLVAVIAFVVIWIVFLTAMCGLAIRAGGTDSAILHLRDYPWVAILASANRLDP